MQTYPARPRYASDHDDLMVLYDAYIACLNRQDWRRLGDFVDDAVIHNGRRLGLAGYRRMLERNFEDIPDLHFNVQLVVGDANHIAARLAFDCTPKGRFLGLAIDGRRVTFAENVFYELRENKIARVWSVIDKAAIEAQL